MFNSFSFITNKTSKSSLIKYLFRLLLFVFVSLILFSRVVNAGISHDEYQFVASSQVLVSNGELPYLDYPFLHMPYQILLNSLAVLVSSYHLLITRCLNAVFSLVSILILFFLVDKLFEGRSPILRNFAGALAVLLFLFDPALISMDGRALNHAFPIMLSLIAFAIFQNGIAKEWPFSNILVCGLLVGLATGTRLSFAVLAVPFLLILLFYPHHQSVLKRIQSISTFLAGLFIAMLPIVFLIIKAPAQFYFGNYVYIRLNTVYRQEVMFQYSMTPIAKIAYFYGNILANPVSFLMYLGMVIISLYMFISLIKGKYKNQILLFMSVLFSYALLTSSFAATPLWPQYFFAPMPFIILSFFIGLSLLQKTSFSLSALILITAIFFVTFPIQETIREVSLITTPTQWIPVKAHQFSQQIQEIVPQGKVVSLAPIYSLEAGLKTYSPFFVGPFVWRTAPLLSAEGRQNYGLVSFHELDAMLMTNPPDAIISGFETDYGFDAYSYGMLEKPLTDYAVANQYKIYKTWKPAFWAKNITLWVRPNQ